MVKALSICLAFDKSIIVVGSMKGYLVVFLEDAAMANN
jgi:hypothetical protein